MPTRPRDIGTAVETATVRFLRTAGWPHAERRALRGIADAGDITGTPGVCWSVKGGQAAERATDQDVRFWMGELRVQRVHSGALLAVLVMKRKAHSAARAGSWWAVMSVAQLGWLLGADPRDTEGLTPIGGRFPAWAYTTPVRMTLESTCELFRHAGFGDVQPEVAA